MTKHGDTQGHDIGSADQLIALADVLGATLPIAMDEIKRGGNPSRIVLADYQMGAESVIATIRGIAAMLAAGMDPFAPGTPEIENRIRLLVDGMGEQG